MTTTTDTEQTPAPRGRPGRKPLPPDERHRRQVISKKKWADSNRERVRAKIRELCRLPRYLEKQRERYALRRQERLAAGWVPNPRGRPRLQFDTEEERAAYLRMKAHERYLRRKERAREDRPVPARSDADQ